METTITIATIMFSNWSLPKSVRRVKLRQRIACSSELISETRHDHREERGGGGDERYTRATPWSFTIIFERGGCHLPGAVVSPRDEQKSFRKLRCWSLEQRRGRAGSCTWGEAARNCDANYHKGGKKINGRARTHTHTRTHACTHVHTKEINVKKRCVHVSVRWINDRPFLSFFFFFIKWRRWLVSRIAILASFSLRSFLFFSFLYFVSSILFFFFCAIVSIFTQSNEAVKLKKRDCATVT